MKRFLSICLAIALLVALVPAVPAMAVSQYGTVTGGWLRLRSAASFDASTVSSYYTGTVVQILGTSGNWYNVKAPDGRTGYMYGSYITINGGGTGTAYVTSTNGFGVRMRTGPGTGYRVLGVYSVGTAVTVLSAGTIWSRIQIGTRVGYMMNQFLTTNGGGGGGGTGNLATIWSANGLGVRLRTGPGTNHAIIGVYSVGTTVNVISRGTTWDYISVGSRVGYMMNAFLRYASTNAVTAVTLSSTTPVVGNVLSAASITPAGATVSYSWYAGSTLVSSAATYTVTAADVNKQIKLTVTGTGSFTGTATSAPTSPVILGTPVTAVTLNNNAPVVGDVLSAATITPGGATVSFAWYVGSNLVGQGATYTVTASDVYQQIRLKVTGTGHFTGSAEVTSTAAVQPTGYITSVAVVNTTNNTTVGNSYPNVGDVLTATPDPATASASYQWKYTDGSTTVLGTSKTLTVTAAMVGKQLKVDYSGTGNYSGAGTALSGTVVSKPNITSITLNKTVMRYDPSPSDPAFNVLTATVLSGTTDATASCAFEWYRGGTLVSGVTGNTYTLSAEDRGLTITVKAIAQGTSSHAGSVSRTTGETVKQRLTAVAIGGSSSTTPGNVAVGDLLSPTLDGGATTANTVIANYSWTLDSATASTLAYTVPTGSVAGKTLTLTVVGKGDYYTDTPLSATATVENATITASAFPGTAPIAGNTYTVTLTPASAATSATFTWTGHSSTYTGATITVDAADIGYPIALVVTPGAGYTGSTAVLEKSTDIVAARTISVAQFFGTFAEGQTIQINTDLPTTDVDHIDWMLDGTLYHSSTSKSLVLPTGSAGKELSATVYGKGNYAGSSKAISGVVIRSDLSMAITLAADFMYEDVLEVPSVTLPDGSTSSGADGSTDATPTPPDATDDGSTPTEQPPESTPTGEPAVTDEVPATEAPATQDPPAPEPTSDGSTLTEPTHYITYRLDPTGSLAAGTDIIALPDITEGIATYEWYLGEYIQKDYTGLDTYTVTQEDLDAQRLLTLVVRYLDGSYGVMTLRLKVADSATATPDPVTEAPATETPTIEPVTDPPTATDSGDTGEPTP